MSLQRPSLPHVATQPYDYTQGGHRNPTSHPPPCYPRPRPPLRLAPPPPTAEETPPRADDAVCRPWLERWGRHFLMGFPERCRRRFFSRFSDGWRRTRTGLLFRQQERRADNGTGPSGTTGGRPPSLPVETAHGKTSPPKERLSREDSEDALPPSSAVRRPTSSSDHRDNRLATLLGADEQRVTATPPPPRLRRPLPEEAQPPPPPKR